MCKLPWNKGGGKYAGSLTLGVNVRMIDGRCERHVGERCVALFVEEECFMPIRKSVTLKGLLFRQA